ncbi:DUF4328 domain-containing protein [Sphingomonas sp. ASY06-1R]|uniref:DUF4328 domain-containing protein n=1 Tax=Sphingomonas sp. ASY06-1R TaxID=3445771 RepID=UPI003FA2507D
MYQYRDLSRITRVATVTLWAYMAVQLIFGMLDYMQNMMRLPSLNRPGIGITEVVGLLSFVVLIATVIIVGRWIYMASANAHTIAPDLQIKAGWAVGWYFIPVANLFKPFQGMKEIWLASRFGLNWQSHTAPSHLRAWWAMWLITNIVGNIAFRTADRYPGPSAVCSLIQGVIEVPLSLILIRIMREIVRGQDATRNQDVFA